MKYFTKYTTGIEREAMRLTTGNVSHHRASIAQVATLLTNRLSYNPERVYISGPISGLPREVVVSSFAAAEKKAREIYPGAEIFNPAREITEGADWVEAMRICKMVLPTCGRIYMMEKWEDSRGAVIEHNDALQLQLEIRYAVGTIPAASILKTVAATVHEHTGVSFGELISRSKRTNVVAARVLAMSAMVHRYGFHPDKVDGMFYRQLGATRHNLKTARNMLDTDKQFKAMYNLIVR